MNAKEFEIALKEAEARLEQLRIRFEQYFLGLERMAPERDHEAFRRSVLELQRELPRNTALRFRYQQMKQKRVTLATYWARVCRQIEEGTYARDVARARQRQGGVQSSTAAAAFEIDVDLDMDMDMDAEVSAALDALNAEEAPRTEPAKPVSKPVSKPPSLSPFAGATTKPRFTPDAPTTATFGRPAGARPTPPNPPSSSAPARPAPSAPARSPAPPPPRAVAPPQARTADLGEDSMRRIYDRYLDARRKNNERVDNVKLATLKKSIDAMMPKLREKHGAKKIDFEVVVKDGRVGLKPVAKDG